MCHCGTIGMLSLYTLAKENDVTKEAVVFGYNSRGADLKTT